MSSLSTVLGLRAATTDPPPTLAGYYIIFHFIFAYGVLSSRIWKQTRGLDHQAAPRQDLAKYGGAAVASGKITQAQLEQMQRVEACSANSVEHFALFVGALLWAQVAGVPRETSNGAALAYTLARFVYSCSYIFTTSNAYAQLRGVAWWVSNVVCLRLLWLGTKQLNSAV